METKKKTKRSSSVESNPAEETGGEKKKKKLKSRSDGITGSQCDYTLYLLYNNQFAVAIRVFSCH